MNSDREWWIVNCFLPSRHRRLPTAYCRLPTAFGGWGLGDEGLPAAGARQHHSPNLSCDSRKPTNLEKEFFF
jgi:hypothetical protein